MRALAVGCAVAGLIIATPAVASAKTGPPTTSDWSDASLAPFNLEVDGTRVLVADGFTGMVGALQPDGTLAPVVTDVPGVAGIATRGKWLAYTSTVSTPPDEQHPEGVNVASGLNIRTPQGTIVYADTHAFEVANNPDAGVTYGPADASCLPDSPFGAHNGLVDSHAYSVASGNGVWYVADAGGNDILKVTDSGQVSLVAVLPRKAFDIPPEAAPAPCLVGTYYSEPVPTDVEVGGDGQLYVTTLTGATEAGIPGLSDLWRINPTTGAITHLAGGFSGATNLALGKNGEIYVAELDGGGISVYRNGVVSPYAALPNALAVETGAGGTVWASTIGLLQQNPVPSRIVSISNGKVKVQAKLP
ncbi:ScyD/ScyE family protein [Microbacterium mangrovi]|nr:ScyD/ScyE family protein [Microbacterium mangrovi]